MTREDGIDEAGKDGARNPETAVGHKRQCANQLIAGFGVSEKTLHAKTQKLIAIGVRVLFTDDDKARLWMTFEKVGQKCASGRACRMPINDVNLRDRRLKIAHVRRERGFQLLDDDFKLSLRQHAFELAQHQGMRRKDTDRQF